MKRARSGYAETNDERVDKVHAFIESLHFSVPLYRLREQQDRRACPKCNKRRLYYCYDCLTVVHPESHPPPLTLPLHVYVVLHPNELRGKSTSLAASTISPDLHIVEYPAVPEQLEPESTLVLYPSEQSVELHEVEHLDQYKNVVFIDSTWQQSKAIARDERVNKFKHVRIKSQTSLFWRFQKNDPTYLATVEAIYYFLREYVTQVNKVAAQIEQRSSSSSSNTVAAQLPTATPAPDAETREHAPCPSATEGVVADSSSVGSSGDGFYRGEVDDLLYYYINQYIGVQQRYTSGDLSKYTDRHFSGYILENTSWDALVAPPAADTATGHAPAEVPPETTH
ncbi:DTW domain containing protein [Novymonas esmeraldas]|uniref:tRNA-uridine aminocarboxypropyltransferase 1 n=1 Tax=Novymonas esmeraldas TaxID=1808958 RepID=A0AAW0ET57_9TRYP